MNSKKDQRSVLDELIQDYLDAFNSGDYRRVASYWTEDAVSVPPTGGEIRGRAALEDFYRNTFETMRPHISDYSYECRFVGDHVIVRESWTGAANPEGQEPALIKGRGLWTAIREPDGVFRTFWSLATFEQP